MAHIFFVMRGINQECEKTKMFLQTQMFNWKRKNLQTGKYDIHKVQGALRPIQLFEYVVPKEAMNEALSMMDIQEGYWGKGKAKYALPFLRMALHAKKLEYKPNKKDIEEIKRIMKINKVPKKQHKKVIADTLEMYKKRGYKLVDTEKFIPRQGVGIEIIGIKDDEVAEWPGLNIEQEML